MRRILWALVLFSSCATVDMEKRVRTGAGVSREKDEPVVIAVPVETPPEPRIIEIERPVYAPPAGAVPPSRESGRTAVQQSNRAGILEPAEYSRAAMIYDYHADWVYEIYTQPLRASDIRLEPGEQVLEAPFISDSERWMLGAGVSREAGLPVQVQHIYVKPTEVSIEASLIINTDKRVYHIILKSFRDIHMPIVRWRYPETGMPHNFISSQETRASGAPADAGMEIAGIDPRFLSFNYRIGYRLGRKPKWLPALVYDDAKKTYITFPEQVLQFELPGCWKSYHYR